jgi:RNA polymerase sigma-70 factor, ECF subfamily
MGDSLVFPRLRGHAGMGLTRLAIGAQANAECGVCLPAHEGAAENQRKDACASRVVELYDELRLPVFRYLIFLGVRPQEAEEIVQECFLRAFQQLRVRGGQEQSLRAWIFRVAHNLAVNQLKKNYRLRGGLDLSSGDLLYPLIDQAPTAEELLLEKERLARLRAAISTLSAQEVQCLSLRAEGLRYREIAEIMGVGISTIAGYMGHVYQKLAT